MDVVQACRSLIAVDSTSQASAVPIAKAIAELAESLGLVMQSQEETSGTQQNANIIVDVHSTQTLSPHLMLQGHLDTADPGDFATWDKTGFNPFDGHVIEGALFGAGVADAKADIVAKLFALHELRQEKLVRRPLFIGTFGAFQGMAGALRFIRRNKQKATHALISMPTGLQIANAGKGQVSLRIFVPFEKDEIALRERHNLSENTSSQSRIFRGRAAAASTPNLGESALLKAFEFIAQLPDNFVLIEFDGGMDEWSVPNQAFLDLDFASQLQFAMTKKISRLSTIMKEVEALFSHYPDKRFDPPWTTLNVGAVRTLTGGVEFSVSCFVPPQVGPEIYESWLARLQSEVEALGARFQIADYKRPFETSPDSIFLSGARSVAVAQGLSADLLAAAQASEASLFHRVGIETIGFGPGRVERNLHGPNESVLVEEISQAIAFYKEVIRRMCL